MQDFRRRFAARRVETSRIAPPFKPLKSYANWFRANYEMFRRSGEVRARPLKLTLDPTNICQLRCPLCPTGYGVQNRKPGHSELHVIEHLMDEVGDYVFFIDFFNWGEPLLTKQIPELIATAHRKGIVTSISTNLSLKLTDERIREIIGSGLSKMVCSIDGTDQESYATYRRRGDFDLAFNNMRRFIEIRNEMGLTRPFVNWQFLVFRFNEHQREKATRMANEIGVDRLSFEPPFLDEQRFPLTDEDSKAVASWTPTDPAFNRYAASNTGDDDEPVPSRCDWHYISSAINWDGSVAPCCTVFDKKDDFGKLDYTAGAGYMANVNNEKFRGVRDLFAGRTSKPLGLICEKCPTPSIMGYGNYVNKRIAVMLAMQCVNATRRVLRLGPGHAELSAER